MNTERKKFKIKKIKNKDKMAKSVLPSLRQISSDKNFNTLQNSKSRKKGLKRENSSSYIN